MRVARSGKSFLLDGSPFQFRGVRHQRAPEQAEPLVDEGDRFRHDLGAMTAAGYTVVSLPAPPDADIERATASGLRFMLELDGANLDSLAAASRTKRTHRLRALTRRIRRSVRAWRGSHALLGLIVDSRALEASSHRGSGAARRIADELAIALHDEDSGLLAAWQSPWPFDDECPAEFDFLLVDCELARWDQLAPAIMDCHGEVGDRPLVLGEVSVGGVEPGSSSEIKRVIDTALWCGAAGTIAQAMPPEKATGSNAETASINRRTVRDLDVDWPSISVVINAYNAASTIDECLSHCGRLDYPNLEVIVVDDGSTDATAQIVGAHTGARLITIARSGLSVGRNVGYQAARGELIAYLDADAYPSPPWPWYLALAAVGERIGGSGGPNVPPAHESPSARAVAQSPAGPVPQLRYPDRAEHIPGCNMAFWRHILEQLHGFDPVLEGAEDLEFEWRVVESGREIAYHPAALVWHHRRPGLGPYLRQQRHYGRGQAILERRYPDRFPARHRLSKVATRLCPRGDKANTPASYPVKYLSLPRQESAPLELAHQWGMPAALLLGWTAPLVLVRRRLAAPAIAASALVGALFAIDVVLAGAGRPRAERRVEVRVRVAANRLLRPLAFRWGHLMTWHKLRQDTPDWPPHPADAGSTDAHPLEP